MLFVGLDLDLLDERLAVCRLEPGSGVADWAASGAFSSVTRTPDEVSVVCSDSRVPEGVRAERGWRALKARGPFPFGLTGILASLAAPLAEAGIGVFAIATYDTDFLLVREFELDQAVEALTTAGHSVHRVPS